MTAGGFSGRKSQFSSRMHFFSEVVINTLIKATYYASVYFGFKVLEGQELFVVETQTQGRKWQAWQPEVGNELPRANAVNQWLSTCGS